MSGSQYMRTVFVLDVSGSMGGMKCQTLHLSATRYIEDIPDNTYVGIVLFDDKFWIEHEVIQINDRSIRDSLISKVPQMARGRTDIAGGLLMGIQAFTQMGISTEGAAIILVTDGEDCINVGNYVDRVLPPLLSAKIKVICIAIGNRADANLERLARETNGNTYIASDSNREMAVRVIESAFQEVKISKELNESITIEVCKELIEINDNSVIKDIIIDSDIGNNTNFTIGSEDFDKFSVIITSPKGQKYDSTSNEFTKNVSLKRYQMKLKRAETGIWKICFTRNVNKTMSATVSVLSQPLNPSAVQMKVWLKDADNNTGFPPIIFCELRKGNDVLIGAEVIATVDKPNGLQSNVILNNIHKIYCNYFTDYSGPGRYNVSVSAKNGSNNCFLKKIDESDSTTGNPISIQFQRQRIVGCFKVTDFMPSKPIDANIIQEIAKSESIKLKKRSFNASNQSVEAPRSRIATAPMDRIRTNVRKVEETNEIKKSKEGLKSLYLVVKRLVGFSKLPETEKEKYKKDLENIESFLFVDKTGTIDDINDNRSKLEELKKRLTSA